jgi:hypothetical protein
MPETIIGEIWKPVVGFETFYSVSSLGRIRRDGRACGTKPGLYLKPRVNRSGYLQIGFRAGANKHFYTIHRVVAVAFIGPCPKGHQINHKNGDKTDNRVGNLEYATPKENIRHSLVSHPRHGEYNSNAKLTESIVKEIRKRAKAGASGTALGLQYGICASMANGIIRHLHWSHC